VIELSSFWIALAVSAALSWPLLVVMRRLKAEAVISQYTPEHAIKAGTPSMGGIAPLLAVLAVSLVAILVWKREPPATKAIGIGLIGFGLLGFFDDFLIPKFMKGKRGFGWTQKLILQIGITALMVAVLKPIGSFQVVASGFLILFFANAVNFSDGLDGLCGGLLIVSAHAFAVGSQSQIAFALIGALIPFLILNAPPAKIFMGDVGALPFGAIFGVMIASASVLANDSVLPLIPVSLIFILELVLVPMQLFWVKVFKKRLIPASPVHHSFEKIGWPETRITAMFLLVQVVLTALTLSLYNSGPDVAL
jgi:phospho-N-acetylmuramoyl-pentapeptide-transferase